MLKKLSIILLAVILLTPIFFQFSAVSVSANHNNAMTSPVTFFNIVGRVTYKQLGRLFSNTQRVVGADDVVVTATGFFDKSKKFTTTTDPNGVYSFNIPDGLYTVRISDPSGKASFTVPPFRVERVNTHRAQKTDFQGLLFR
jgi:hypothetical protein